MQHELIKHEDQAIIQKLVLSGDISQMDNNQKVQYYNKFCQLLGLNPLTQPFAIIKFQGKERLYAQKDCTEQLRKIHGVSITDISTTSLSDVFIVTAKALDKNGKTDCSTGAVNIKGLTGEALANALMKAETKAKRRVTLSICGLGILDESETDTLPSFKTETIEVKKIENKKVEPASFLNGDMAQQFNESHQEEVYGMDDIPNGDELNLLHQLVYTSKFTERAKNEAHEKINNCRDFKKYDEIKYSLQDNQLDYNTVANPNSTDAKKIVAKIVGPKPKLETVNA